MLIGLYTGESEATMENSMKVPQKIKNGTTIQSISFLWRKKKKQKTEAKKNLTRKDTYNPMFIPALFTIAKLWKQHKCLSINE